MKYFWAFISAISGFLVLLMVGVYVQMFLGYNPTQIPIVIENTDEYEEVKYQLIGQDIGTLILALIFLALFSYFYASYRRLNKRKKDTYNKDDISGPFVLYLRSFLDDKRTSRFVSVFNDNRTEEEIMVDVFSDIAPVYAIGDPKDKRMPNGASRIYVEDEHWKSVVKDLAQKAVMVVLRLGKTDSFWWEVEMVLDEVPIENIVFVVPTSKTFDNIAMLYKILLRRNIDIKDLGISIDKKDRGSISTFVYFDNNKKPHSTDIKISKFTQLIISYENVLRNNLNEVRQKFGLEYKKLRTISYARIWQSMIILYVFLIGGSIMYHHYVSLRYQMPYEFLESCIDHSEFVEKYSDEINGTNFCWGVYESEKGAYLLNDIDYRLMYLIECKAINQMTSGELNQLYTAPQNKLLMVKKYTDCEDYKTYVGILSKAVSAAVINPEGVKETIQLYQSNIENLPQWVYESLYCLTRETSEYAAVNNFNAAILEHFGDADICDILKTISSTRIDVANLD